MSYDNFTDNSKNSLDVNSEYTKSDSGNTSEEEVENQYKAVSTFDQELGCGYQVLNNDKPYINQPHIPAIEGMKGFENEQDALKTAEFVIYKLQNNIVPPSLSTEELDSLGIVY